MKSAMDQKEIANNYQEFFNFFSQEHNLILTIEQIQEILIESEKQLNKLLIHNISNTLCEHQYSRDIDQEYPRKCIICKKSEMFKK